MLLEPDMGSDRSDEGGDITASDTPGSQPNTPMPPHMALMIERIHHGEKQSDKPITQFG